MLKNEEILEQFKKSLTATTKSISQNNLVEINFTKEIIQEFKQYWNWSKLKENKHLQSDGSSLRWV